LATSVLPSSSLSMVGMMAVEKEKWVEQNTQCYIILDPPYEMVNKSSHSRQKRNNHHTKCWLKLVRWFLKFLYSKHLSIHCVTFLSPLKQMGFVSYKYCLVAKSHVHLVSCHVILVLIFCHIVPRGTHPLLLIHAWHGSRWSSTSSWESIWVIGCYVSQTYCPHKYRKVQRHLLPSFVACNASLAELPCLASLQQTQHWIC
jgi:hypothetical protein